MKYAVIDVETTGLNPLVDRIIEIGLLLFDNDEETSKYTILINPGKSIPVAVTSLTGITSAMVKNCIGFEAVAEEIDKMTKNFILVGHNVEFDYAFLKNEMRNEGISFSRKTICTAELSRIFFPGKKSHSLKALCKYFGIVNHQPHRALSDATATANAFHQIKSRLGDHFIDKLLIGKKPAPTIALNWISNRITELPKSAGVYYFIGHNNKPIYIGKAKNIKSRIKSHFRGDGNSLQLVAAMPFIKEINYQETGNELLAALLEDHEIRHYWPSFNRAQKSNIKRFGIAMYIDMKNRWRIGIAGAGKSYCYSIYFHQYHLASKYVSDLVNKYCLDNVLCGTGTINSIVSVEIHNRNFELMLDERNRFVVIELYFTSGRNEHEQGFVFIEDGVYKGFGFVPNQNSYSAELFEQNLIRRYSSVTVENIIIKLRKKSEPDLIFQSKKNSSHPNLHPELEAHTIQFSAQPKADRKSRQGK